MGPNVHSGNAHILTTVGWVLLMIKNEYFIVAPTAICWGRNTWQMQLERQRFDGLMVSGLHSAGAGMAG